MSLATDAQTDLVKTWLHSTTVSARALAPVFRYRGELATIGSPKAYAAAAARWKTDGEDLFSNYHTEVTRCTQLADDPDAVAVRWRASWSPETVLWLERLASLAGWSLERFEPPSDRVSTFSWRAVFELLSTALTSGVLRLPLAAVEGRAVVRVDEATRRCTAVSETIDLLAEADAGRLLNRKVAQELAAWLDVCRRPEDVDADEWAAAVRSRCLSGVPGAGVLDVDPIEDGPASVAAFGLLSAALLAASVGAVGRETGVFGASICDEVAGGASDGWFAQCVSDVLA